jgi:hypothetical protein
MLTQALAAEVDAYTVHSSLVSVMHGRRLMVRNSYHEPRQVLSSAGAVEVQAPWVNDKAH